MTKHILLVATALIVLGGAPAFAHTLMRPVYTTSGEKLYKKVTHHHHRAAHVHYRPAYSYRSDYYRSYGAYDARERQITRELNRGMAY